MNKDFSDDSDASVTVSLDCASGTDSPDSAQASEALGATFTVTGFDGDPLCTATEEIPVGYNSSGTCSALLSVGSCTIVNNLNTATFVVNKDFIPDSGAAVTVSLSCDSGTDTPATHSITQLTPGTFTVTGFTAPASGVNCTATESPIPLGYTALNNGTCTAALSIGSCTITNTLNEADFIVRKDFSDGNTASVSVTLSCLSGTVTSTNPQPVSEAAFATYHVVGFEGDPVCTATESPIPPGYVSTGTCSANLLDPGECTIENTLRQGGFQVLKDFNPDSAAPVTVSLVCGGGATVTPASAPASEGTPAVFTVTGFTGDPSCTATESPIPAGYNSPDNGTCVAAVSVGFCTIVNNLNTADFRVLKDFSDDDPMTVSVSLDCTTGDVSPPSQLVSEGNPVSFEVTGFTAPTSGVSCTATESPIPAGYSSPDNGTCTAALSVGECTITNTLSTATFDVIKDFVPDARPGSVNVTLSTAPAVPLATAVDATASEADRRKLHGLRLHRRPALHGEPRRRSRGLQFLGTRARRSFSAGTCTIINTLNSAQVVSEQGLLRRQRRLRHSLSRLRQRHR